MVVIEAPSNLGLRPAREAHEPGTWAAPEALRRAGLLSALGVSRSVRLVRPIYSFDPPQGSRIRNGPALRSFSESLAATVLTQLEQGEFPLVIGGDCSILLGCLLAARSAGPCALVHLDGHSDFAHPGNYDPSTRLGNAAGMDLALVTGRGEPLLAGINPASKPLVADQDAIQIGERENLDPDYAFPDIAQTAIHQIDIRRALALGMPAVARRAADTLRSQSATRGWLHLDLDILDANALPAVDCPGSPGLSFEQLAELLAELHRRIPFIGADVSAFDPELDRDGSLAERVVQTLAIGFAPVIEREQALI